MPWGQDPLAEEVAVETSPAGGFGGPSQEGAVSPPFPDQATLTSPSPTVPEQPDNAFWAKDQLVGSVDANEDRQIQQFNVAKTNTLWDFASDRAINGEGIDFEKFAPTKSSKVQDIDTPEQARDAAYRSAFNEWREKMQEVIPSFNASEQDFEQFKQAYDHYASRKKQYAKITRLAEYIAKNPGRTVGAFGENIPRSVSRMSNFERAFLSKEVERIGGPEVAQSFLGRAGEAFSRGVIGAGDAFKKIGSWAVATKDQEKAVNAFADLTSQSMGQAPIAGKDAAWYQRGFYGAVQMAPNILGSVATGVATGGAGPLAYWWAQGAAEINDAMRQHGVDEGYSKPIAALAAVPYAAIEMMQIRQLAPGLVAGARDVMATSIAGALKKLGAGAAKNYAKEMSEEAAQGIIVQASKALGVYLDENAPEIDWSKDIKGFLSQMEEAAVSMPFLMGPGAAVQGVQDVQSAQWRGKVEAFAKANPEAATLIAQQEVPGRTIFQRSGLGERMSSADRAAFAEELRRQGWDKKALPEGQADVQATPVDFAVQPEGQAPETPNVQTQPEAPVATEAAPAVPESAPAEIAPQAPTVQAEPAPQAEAKAEDLRLPNNAPLRARIEALSPEHRGSLIKEVSNLPEGQREARLDQLLQQVYEGNTDPLTGLPTRRTFEALDKEGKLGPAKMVMDVVGLGVHNDAFDYAAGDALLVGVSGVAKKYLDLVRYGGDELAAHGADMETLRAQGNALNKELRDLTYQFVDSNGNVRTLKGARVVFGLGETAKKAASLMERAKEVASATGIRPAKGQIPGFLVEVDAEGRSGPPKRRSSDTGQERESGLPPADRIGGTEAWDAEPRQPAPAVEDLTKVPRKDLFKRARELGHKPSAAIPNAKLIELIQQGTKPKEESNVRGGLREDADGEAKPKAGRKEKEGKPPARQLPKVGEKVKVNPKDDLNGSRRRKAVYGPLQRIEEVNGKKFAVVKADGQEWIVPVEKAERMAGKVAKEEEAARMAKEYTPKQLEQIEKASHDTRVLAAQVVWPLHEQALRKTERDPYRDPAANAELQDLIDVTLRREMGMEGSGWDAQSEVLPFVLEAALQQAEKGTVLPKLKSVEFIGAVGQGDTITLGGQKWTATKESKGGSVTLTNEAGDTISFYRNYVPVDKGTKRKRGEKKAAMRAGKPVPIDKVQTGKPAVVEAYRGFGRAERESVYGEMSAGIPILGRGRYYALTKEAAQEYGGNVEKTAISMKNPLVIDSPEVWQALTKEAGWRYPNPVGQPVDLQRAQIWSLDDLIREKGYDGIVVRVNNRRLLEQVFGEDQIHVPEPGKLEDRGGPLSDEGQAQPPKTSAKVVNETDLLGQERARVEGAGGKVEQGQIFDNEVSPELARERKLRDAHREAGGKELDFGDMAEEPDLPEKPDDDIPFFVTDDPYQTPVMMEPNAKPISNHEIIKTLERIFDVPIRMGRVSGRPAGFYKVFDELVRLKGKFAGDLGVATHEVAHHIDKITGLSKAVPKHLRAELSALDYDPNQKRIFEGWAEFVRHLLTEDDAQKIAPNFYEWFRGEWSPAHPKLAEHLIKSKEYINRWRAQGAEARVEKSISWNGETARPLDVSWMDWFKEKASSVWTQFRDAWVDDAEWAKKFEEYARAQGWEGGHGSSPYEYVMAMSQTGPALARTAVMEGVFSVSKNMNKIGPSLQEAFRDIAPEEYKGFVTWMYARHAVESWRKGKNPGISIEDAQYVLDKGASAKWEKAADAITAFNNALVDMLAEAKVITFEDAERMRAYYKTYIPLMRAKDSLRGRMGLGAKNIIDLGSPIFGRKGSGLQVIDPVMATMERATRFYTRALQQQAIERFIEVARKTPGMGRWITQVAPHMVKTTFSAGEALRQIGAMFDMDFEDLPEQMKEVMLEIYKPLYKGNRGDAIARVISRDRKTLWQFDPDLYKAISGMNFLELPKFLDLTIGAGARLARLGMTGLNLSFGARNVPKDFGAYLFQRKETPGPKALVAPFQAVASYVFSESQRLAGNEQNPHVQLWKEFGGPMSTTLGLDRQNIRTQIDELMRHSTGDRIIDIAKHPIEALREAVSITEVGPRLAEFTAVMERHGYSRDRLAKMRKVGQRPPTAVIIEAMQAAHDVTVNFKRGGTIGKYVNRMLPLFNAPIQGSDKYVRTWKDNPKRTFIYGSMLAAATALYWMVHRDDDWYREAPPWLKYGFWTATDGEGKPIYRIPRPIEWGWTISAGTEAILDSIYRKDPGEFKRYGGQTIESLIPNLKPAIITPVLESTFNYDTFRGAPIVGDDLKNRLPEDQYHAYNTELMKKIGQYLHMSPAKLEHIAEGVTGGLFGRVERAAETPITGKKGYEDITGQTAFDIKRDYSQTTTDFYKHRNAITQQYNSANDKAKKDGGKVDAKLKAEHKRLEEIAGLMSKLREGIKDTDDRDERFKHEKYIIGLSRFALGKEALDRYPSLLSGDTADMPEAVKDIRDEYLGRLAYRMSTPRPKREKGEPLEHFQQRREEYKALLDEARGIFGDLDLSADEMVRLLRAEAKRRGYSTRLWNNTGRSAYGDRLWRLRAAVNE